MLGSDSAAVRFEWVFRYSYILVYTFIWFVYGGNVTAVLSIRVKKSLKLEAEKLGVDLKAAVEKTLEKLLAEKKTHAQQVAKELQELMDVNAQEWIDDVAATRKET
jgi:hypothetical protein